MPIDPHIPVLVVDDNRTMVRIIRNLLKQIGFDNVDEADNGQNALNQLQKKSYTLIISDWNMEPMDGLEFLKKLRADAALKNIKFVMVTAQASPENVLDARKAGVDGYIVKPFTADTLRSKVEAVFQG